MKVKEPTSSEKWISLIFKAILFILVLRAMMGFDFILDLVRLSHTTFHERKGRRIIHQILEGRTGSVVDAGAYVGDHAIDIANRHENVHVYAVEPNKTYSNYISRKNIHNLTSLNLLLSDHEGRGCGKTNQGFSNATYEKCEKGMLEMKSLDELVRDGVISENVIFLHFDTEGHELECLKGSERTIKGSKPIVMVETLGDDELFSIVEYMRQFSYDYFTIDEKCAYFTSCRNHIFYLRGADPRARS